MLDKILKFLKIHFSSALTLRDTTPIELSGDLETGVNVFIVTPDGNIAMPDGEYCLSDESIIIVKDGIIMDVISPTEEAPEVDVTPTFSEETPVEPVEPVEPVVEPEAVPETTEPVIEEELQKGNPIVTGDLPEDDKEEDDMIPSGKTSDDEIPIDENMAKITNLETKFSDLENSISEIMGKLNMISEKFSAAQPIVKRKEDNQPSNNFSQDIIDKVELIKKLKKS
jgi:hypothetical protein